MRRAACTTLAVVALFAMACGPPPPAGTSTSGTGPPGSGAPGSVAPGSAPEAPVPDRAALLALADVLRTETGADGAIVALQSGSGPAETVVTGVADGRTGSPLEPGTAFPVASVTKSFTAALALDAARSGAVDLDAPIDRWVDWPGGDRITLRQLLLHTSGIAGFGNKHDPVTAHDTLVLDAGRRYTIDEVLDAARPLPAIGPPGAGTYYSNTNYLLAGRILERALGRPFGDLLADRIARPLALGSTWYLVDGPPGPAPAPGLAEVIDGAPPLHTADYPQTATASLGGPSVAAVSSMPDLLRWGDAVFRRHRLGSTDLGPMTEVAPGGYGLGVAGVTADGACVFDGCPAGARFERLELAGNMPGASTRLVYDPATDTLLGVYLNRAPTSIDRRLVAFLDALTPPAGGRSGGGPR